jgi:DNA-binding XRE family transcriptional regulator
MDTFKSPQQEETLGSYIKRLRLELKMSQNDLSKSAGIHLHSLGKIERGITTRLNDKTRRLIARALSIPTEYLEAVCKREKISPYASCIKFCPRCWVPGTPTEPIWDDVRSKHCFICGFELMSYCLKCGRSVTSNQHSYCPYCGFYYKNTIIEMEQASETKRKKSNK